VKKTNAYSEVRRFARLPASQKVEYKELGDTIDTTSLRTSKLKNLSPGGLQFISARPAQPADILQLKFPLSLDRRKLDIPVIARVIHCRRLKPGQYAIGVEFVDFQWTDIHALHTFVKKRGK
jgi:c-di-GMP-binding flagellar brake protein YcgR